MAVLFDDAANQYLLSAAAPVVAAPLTMAAWVNSDDNTLQQCVMSLAQSTVDNHYFSAWLAGNIAGNPVEGVSRQGVPIQTYDTTTGYTAGTWHHVCDLQIANNSRAIYVDGGDTGVNVVISIPAGINRLGIGILARMTLANPLSGLIAHACVWNVALSDEEIAFLATGAIPTCVQRESIVAYYPLFRMDAITDEIGTYDLTAFNAPTTAADTPGIYSPAGVLQAIGIGI